MRKAGSKILACTDLKADSLPALARGVSLAVRMRAQLHLCHISKGLGTAAASSIGLDAAEEPPSDGEALRQQVQAQLEALAEKAKLAVHIHIRRGRPIEEILRLIAELEPELVIVARPPTEPFRRVQLGALTRQLAARSPAAVLIVPAI